MLFCEFVLLILFYRKQNVNAYVRSLSRVNKLNSDLNMFLNTIFDSLNLGSRLTET